MTGERDFDLIVFGATGFTGRQVVAYLKKRAPAKLRWAIAGRKHDTPHGLDAGVPIVLADSTDPVGLADVVSRARVVLNIAGPCRRLGDPIVAACIESGTHYCDISGETARIRDLIDVYHIAAKRAGVRIVCFGGASSAPVDLAVHMLQERVDGGLCRAVAVLRLRTGFSMEELSRV